MPVRRTSKTSMEYRSVKILLRGLNRSQCSKTISFYQLLGFFSRQICLTTYWKWPKLSSAWRALRPRKVQCPAPFNWSSVAYVSSSMQTITFIFIGNTMNPKRKDIPWPPKRYRGSPMFYQHWYNIYLDLNNAPSDITHQSAFLHNYDWLDKSHIEKYISQRKMSLRLITRKARWTEIKELPARLVRDSKNQETEKKNKNMDWRRQ